MEQKSDVPDFNFNIALQKPDDILSKQSSDHEYNQKSFNKNHEESQYSKTNSESTLKDKLSTYDLSKANHPIACIFTIFFKLTAILCYYLFELFDVGNTLTFIIVALFCALDFWTLKNITGRLLVGLRWWSDFKEDGNEVWIFESYDGDVRLNIVDSSFFWTPQIACGVFWALLLFYHLITFSLYWGILNALAFLLISVNLMAFYRCNKEHVKKVEEMENYMKMQGLKFISQNLLNQTLKKLENGK